MKIGTHNSMTYLPLKHWWMYPFNWIAKCQSLSIEEQYELGVRLFDIRISYDKDYNLEFRHGLIAYKGNVIETLSYLNSKQEPIQIRIILEKPDKDQLFGLDIIRFQKLFPNLTFYEGRKKSTWKQIVSLPLLDLNQLVGSMSGKLLYKIFPKLYAKKYNEINVHTYLDYKPLLIDFYDESISCFNT